jgi:probable HAF family extracellular repeat protein
MSPQRSSSYSGSRGCSFIRAGRLFTLALGAGVLATLAGCGSAADSSRNPSLLAPTEPRAIAAANTTVDLGSLGGGITLATALGKMGYVTGGSTPSAGSDFHAFLWSASTGMRDLGTLGTGAVGLSVNGKGEVAGVNYPSPSGLPRAFFWSEKTGMIDIGVMPGGTTSTAKGINDAGTVVGWSDNGQGGLRPFAWTLAGGMKDLGDLGGGGGGAAAINSSGVIVGWSNRAGGSSAATRWVPGRPPKDLGQPGVSSQAEAINDLGLIVGEINLWVNGLYSGHAMYWRESTGMVDIGTLGGRDSRATAVNYAGTIFGYSDVPGGTSWHSFEWNAGTGMTDIFPATGFSWVSGVLDRNVVAYSSTVVRLSK